MFSCALKLPEPEPMATTRLRPQALHHTIRFIIIIYLLEVDLYAIGFIQEIILDR